MQDCLLTYPAPLRKSCTVAPDVNYANHLTPGRRPKLGGYVAMDRPYR